MPPLQFITHCTPAISYGESVRIALAGGCRWVQLRMKGATEAELEAEARRAVKLCRACGATLIIDDCPEVARRVGADGVHLGRDDMPVSEARRLLGPGFIIGGTANTIDDIRRLHAAGADYIGCGPFRFTTTKRRLAPTIGLDGYRTIARQMEKEGLRLPVVAIGGITRADIADIRATGIGGIALSGAVLRAQDPVGEMRAIVSLLSDTTNQTIHTK